MSVHLVREATSADFDDVMAFGEMFDGIDYLRHRYHSFQKDANASPYVYVIGDKVVGYCCAFLVDDGMTLLIRGSRVKGDCQGQGIYGNLTKHVYNEFRGVPNLKYEAFTANNLTLDAQKGINSTYTELSRKIGVIYRLGVENIDFPPFDVEDGVVKMTSEDMTSFLACDDFDVLCPGGKIIVDWVPLRPLISNMKYILNNDTVAFQSKNTDSRVLLVSLCTTVPCKRGIKYQLDIYGSEVKYVRAHVLNHLHNLPKSTKDIILRFFVEIPIGKAVNDIVKSLGISDLGIRSRTMHNFERAFIHKQQV